MPKEASIESKAKALTSLPCFGPLQVHQQHSRALARVPSAHECRWPVPARPPWLGRAPRTEGRSMSKRHPARTPAPVNGSRAPSRRGPPPRSAIRSHTFLLEIRLRGQTGFVQQAACAGLEEALRRSTLPVLRGTKPLDRAGLAPAQDLDPARSRTREHPIDEVETSGNAVYRSLLSEFSHLARPPRQWLCCNSSVFVLRSHDKNSRKDPARRT
jgi:hypothetical protein